MHCKYITLLKERTNWGLWSLRCQSSLSLSLVRAFKKKNVPRQWFIIHFINTSWFFILKLAWQIKKMLSPLFLPHVSSSFSGGVTCHFHFTGAKGTGRERRQLCCAWFSSHSHTDTQTHGVVCLELKNYLICVTGLKTNS